MPRKLIMLRVITYYWIWLFCWKIFWKLSTLLLL